MRIITLASTILALALSAGPVLAGYGPAGHWTCSTRDAVVGALDITNASYVFAKAGTDDPADGTVTISGTSIDIGSGPLKDMGFGEGKYGTDPGLGLYMPSGDWAGRLVFDGGQQGGMSCIPRYPHN